MAAEPTPRRHHAEPSVDAPAGKRFFPLLLIAGLLCVVGLIMVLSASAAEAEADHGTPWYQFQRQALWLGIGVVAMIVVQRIDYHRWRRFVGPMVLGTLVLLVVVLVPGVGREVNGSTRWLGIGSFTIQPSEVAKLALLLFAADLLARRANRIHRTDATLRPVLVVFGAMGVLIMAQPNLGTTFLLFAICVTMLFVAGVPGRSLAVTVAGVGALGVAAAVFEPYRMRRLLAFTDPWADPLNTGYQTLQSQAALASGGATGQGLGQGRAKYGFLPEGHTDFIFSNIGEEFGLLGAVVLLGLFVAIGVLGVGVALAAPDRFGMLVATGVTTWILVQAFVNLGAVVGLLPITGVPLPFVSSGGSSLIVTMVGFGMLLNVARHSER
ncbi:MAG: putative lipid II flippase FtsW [Acidimicrobiia bacterium]|nr:putative lipid II flippase FtsW [Acidimicrobiia bacterium]